MVKEKDIKNDKIRILNAEKAGMFSAKDHNDALVIIGRQNAYIESQQEKIEKLQSEIIKLNKFVEKLNEKDHSKSHFNLQKHIHLLEEKIKVLGEII